MSWYLDFHAQSVRQAIEFVERQIAQNPHFPETAGRSVVASLNSLQDCVGQIIHVRSEGFVRYTHGSVGVIGRHNLLVEQNLTLAAPADGPKLEPWAPEARELQLDIEDVITTADKAA